VVEHGVERMYQHHEISFVKLVTILAAIDAMMAGFKNPRVGIIVDELFDTDNS
jgi:hypothetical protein